MPGLGVRCTIVIVARRSAYFTPPAPITLNAVFVARGDTQGRERVIRGIQCGRGPADTIISITADLGRVEPYAYEAFIRLFEFRRHRARRTSAS